MIAVKRHNFCLKMTGHAGSAPYGEDLVCAAASMLCYALAAQVQGCADIRLEKGRACISARPKPEDEAAVNAAFDTVTKGFELLCEKYPEYIKFV